VVDFLPSGPVVGIFGVVWSCPILPVTVLVAASFFDDEDLWVGIWERSFSGSSVRSMSLESSMSDDG